MANVAGVEQPERVSARIEPRAREDLERRAVPAREAWEDPSAPIRNEAPEPEDLLVDAYDYDLPPDRIAQAPNPDRDGSRLLHLDRRRTTLGHHRFKELPQLLQPGDLLVLNDTRVIAARIRGRRATGGRVEALFLARIDESVVEDRRVERWNVLLSPSSRLKVGERLQFPEGTTLVLESWSPGSWQVRVEASMPVMELLDTVGETPLPPYIKRSPEARRDSVDRRRYQTVYARVPGSAAAPTAGLHFTEPLLEALEARGVQRTHVTLHVGLGTFSPVRVERVADHLMHAEWFHVPVETLHVLRAARREGRRIVAVGTTSVRVLETIAGWESEGRTPDPRWGWRGETSIFIYPGHRFALVDAMITNFHVPKSSLIMLVSAFAGRKRILAAYAEALDKGYRFFSYGDAMLIT